MFLIPGIEVIIIILKYNGYEFNAPIGVNRQLFRLNQVSGPNWGGKLFRDTCTSK